MARTTQVYSIDYVAKTIGESPELIEVVSWNSDDIDFGEMIHVHDGTEEGITTSPGVGSTSFARVAATATRDESMPTVFNCEPDVIERIMASEKET